MIRTLPWWSAFTFLFAMPIVTHSQVLYAYGFLNGSSTVQVDSVNLSTGALTPVATTDGIVVGPQAAVDPIGHRLFLFGGPTPSANTLYTVNLTTGSISKLLGSFGSLVFDSGVPNTPVPTPVASTLSLVLCGFAILVLARGVLKIRARMRPLF
ncbi:MAG TPA: hypothetical protein VEU96_04815 [Bryobacteraceae bacterium]|nr:hypothetical protein [Bryobacteraceae bacterium]